MYAIVINRLFSFGTQAVFLCREKELIMTETQESTTAKLCSFARAYHSNMDRQKIFDDYLAYDLMGKEEYERIGELIDHDFEVGKSDQNYSFCSANIAERLRYYILPIPLSRIAFAEQKLYEFAQQHEKCQYVVCGAGMDTFAFRNDNADIHVFELDHPNTGKYKRERVRQLEWNIPENLTFVPIDFSKDNMQQKLLHAGFHPELPSFFAILGVSYYLTLSVFEQTIETIGTLCSAHSKIVFDYPDETTLSRSGAERIHTLTEITEKLGEKMLHGYSFSEIDTALKKNGYQIEDHRTPQEIQKAFFDNRTDGISAFENIHFISAEKEYSNPKS